MIGELGGQYIPRTYNTVVCRKAAGLLDAFEAHKIGAFRQNNAGLHSSASNIEEAVGNRGIDPWDKARGMGLEMGVKVWIRLPKYP